ncbi:MAG: hypothetical protein OEU54_00225 [Gemmatimonadota bacterium]|nr:hypothetical protein [Gemmatimonadota bacterium]
MIAGLAALMAAPVAAQRVKLTPTAGYTLGGSLSGRDFSYSLGDGFSWGGILGLGVARGSNFALIFNYMSTDLTERNRSTNVSSVLGDVAVWHLQGGGSYEFGGSDNVTPFVDGHLGVSVMNPGDLTGFGQPSTETRFGFNFGLGADVARWIKVGSRLWLVLTNAGGGFWCGPGGCAVGAGGDVVAQIEFYGGINIGGRRR